MGRVESFPQELIAAAGGAAGMITVTTPSRLHFGLISLAEHGACWPNRAGAATTPARRFGGVGLMIDRPSVRLRVAPGAEWSAHGPLAERALAFARRYAETSEPGLSPRQLVVENAPPQHVGLGVGTQLGLAVAKALSVAEGHELPIAELAHRVGRGLRSGIGAHGFGLGGFLVDGGRAGQGALAPLVTRVDFPEEWRVVVATPPTTPGVHGEQERAAFAELRDDLRRTDALCRLVLLGIVPALVERDLDTFSAALSEFNERAGEPFAELQGGPHVRPAAELIAFLRGEGVRGVGQSSWGPTTFAIVGDPDRATRLVARLRERFRLSEGSAYVASGCNRGATLTADDAAARV